MGGNISGTLANQTDLQSSLNAKSEKFPIIINANANATVGRSHHVTGAFTVVLPDGSSVGELITILMKRLYSDGMVRIGEYNYELL